MTVVDGREAWRFAPVDELLREVERQDRKHGPFTGSRLGRTRLAIACVQDELDEALEAWRLERRSLEWIETRAELLQVAAVALRAVRDLEQPDTTTTSNEVSPLDRPPADPATDAGAA